MNISTDADIRTGIISRIWAYATAMFLIAILIDRRSSFLPATIVLGATVTSIVALRKLREPQLSASMVGNLKQRIENLEAIAASETGEGNRTLQLDRMTIERH